MGKLLERILLISLGITICLMLLTSGVIPFLKNISLFEKFNETNIYESTEDFVADLDNWIHEAIDLGDNKDIKNVEKYFYLPNLENLNLSFGLRYPYKEWMLPYPDLDVCIESLEFGKPTNEIKRFVSEYPANLVERQFENLQPKEYYILIRGCHYDKLENEYFDPSEVHVDIFDGLTVKKEKEDAEKAKTFLKDFIDSLHDFYQEEYYLSGLIYNSTIMIPDNIETIYLKGNKTLFSWYLNDKLQVLGGQQEFMGFNFIDEKFSLIDQTVMNISIYIYDSKLAVIFWKTRVVFNNYMEIVIPDWAENGCGSIPPPDYEIPYYLLL